MVRIVKCGLEYENLARETALVVPSSDCVFTSENLL